MVKFRFILRSTKLLFFVFLLLFSFQLAAQKYPNLISPKEISTIGYWNLGEEVTYAVVKKTERFSGKKKPKTFEESYRFSLKIKDSTEKSYTFEMTYSDIQTEKGDPILDQLAQLKANMKVRYQTDELGTVDSILNVDALRKSVLEKLNVIQLELKTNSMDSLKREVYSFAIAQMKSAFEDLENTESLFLSDILFLHGYFGISMQLGKTYDVDLNYPCLGDFVLTGKGTVALNSIFVNADECIFSVNERPDSQELLSYVKLISSYFFMDERKKPFAHNLKITMKTQNKMRMTLSSGWMKKVTSVSTTVIKDLKKEYRQVTRLEFERVG